MTEFLTALTGALFGAFMVFIAELWKQALIGKAAARFIRAESLKNVQSILSGLSSSQLYDDAWRTHGIEVAPLLTLEASDLALVTVSADTSRLSPNSC